MPFNQNKDRLNALLKKFTQEKVTATTAVLTTVTGSTGTITNQAAVNNFAGCGDTADSAGATGESQIIGVYHESTARGFYTYQEEVSLVGTINATDKAVICQLSKQLPANAKIVSAALVGEDRSDLSVVTVGLYLSSGDAVAQGTAVTADVVEVIGASVGSAALAYGDSGTDGDTEIFSVANGQDVGPSLYPYVCSDGTGNTPGTATAGSVIVTINYWGSAAPA